jgi:hypothetical protein
MLLIYFRMLLLIRFDPSKTTTKIAKLKIKLTYIEFKTERFRAGVSYQIVPPLRIASRLLQLIKPTLKQIIAY